MKVSLGTIVLDDEERRLMRREFGKSGKASREQVRDRLIVLIDDYLGTLGALADIVEDTGKKHDKNEFMRKARELLGGSDN